MAAEEPETEERFCLFGVETSSDIPVLRLLYRRTWPSVETADIALAKAGVRGCVIPAPEVLKASQVIEKEDQRQAALEAQKL